MPGPSSLRPHRCIGLAAFALLLACGDSFTQDQRSASGQSEPPDIRTVTPDLAIPKLSEGTAAAGKRVRAVVPGWEQTEVYFILYLPTNYRPGEKYPLIVEFAGNGGFTNKYGDTCDGTPEGCKLGFGMSGGQDFIWCSLPFVTGDGKEVARQWWGSPPEWSPDNTVQHSLDALDHLVADFDVDPDNMILSGFSRGAIACNFIGLQNDEIASRWKAFVAYSHYDGSRDWRLPGTDPESARRRLQRLGDRPAFICHEVVQGGRGLEATKQFLANSGIDGKWTLMETGFRNHNDAWVLRPSAARAALRKWLHAVVELKEDSQEGQQ